MKFKFKSLSINFLTSESTIHGIRYIGDEKVHKAIRLFWSIAFLLSIIGLSYYAYGVYLKWRITPDISIAATLKPIREIPFVAVTICSPLSVKNEYANYQDIYNHVTREGHDHPYDLPIEEQKTISAISQSCDPATSDSFVNIIKHDAANEVVNYLKKSSFTTDEAMFLCFINSEVRKNCTEMFNRIITDFGICYSFNMNGYHTIFNENILSDDFDLYKRQTIRNVMKKKSNYFNDKYENVEWTLQSGYASNNDKAFPMRVISENSVKFILKIPKIETNNYCPPLHNSYKVIFHMPNEIPTKFHEYIYSAMDTQFFISMTAKHYTTDVSLRNFSPEMRGCYFDGERKLMFFRSYTKAHCDLECLTNFTLRECGCVKFSMPRMSTTPVCDLARSQCYNLAFRRWPQDDKMSDDLAMPCNCYPPCANIKYRTKLIDHVDINASYVREIYERNLNNNFSEIFTSIVIVFEEFLIDEQVNFVAFKLQNFIAECGGLLGLFMGCSLLSIVELIYLCIKGLIKYWHERKEGGNMSHNDDNKLNFNRFIQRREFKRRYLKTIPMYRTRNSRLDVVKN